MFPTTNPRQLANDQRRQLHARIARSRRRINGHTTRLVHGGLLPLAWRRTIQDHPIAALATAAGAGMLLSQLAARNDAARKSADWLARWMSGGTWETLMRHVERFVAAGDAAGDASATEPQDG